MAHANDERTPEKLFGEQVRAARESRGWSQEYLRELLHKIHRIDLSRTAVVRLEQARRPIRLNEVSALAHLLQLELSHYSRLTDASEYEDAKTERASLEKAVAQLGKQALEMQERLLTEQTRLIFTQSELAALDAAIYDYEQR